MPVIKIKKDLIVSDDISFGTGTITQTRGQGRQIDSSVIPYSDSESIKDVLDSKASINSIDDKLADKADLQGNESISFKVADGSLPSEAINKSQLDNAIAPLETTASVNSKLYNKANLQGNAFYTFNVDVATLATEAINKLQLEQTIAPLETTADVDTKIAAVNAEVESKADLVGSQDIPFFVDTPVNNNQATDKLYVDTELANKADITYVDTELSTKADQLNVLLKDGSSPYFDPVSNNQPATKKYVDDSVVAIGAGDMAKSVYDTNNSGTVDSAEAIGVIGTILGKTPMNQILRLAQSNVVDANILDDYGLYIGSNIANTPISGQLIIMQMVLGDSKHQTAYDLSTPDIYIRAYNGTTWTAWQKNARVEDSVRIVGDTMSGALNFLNSAGVNIYNSSNVLKSVLSIAGSILNVGDDTMDVNPKGTWDFGVNPTSNVSPSNAADLTRKDYVDTLVSTSVASAVPTGVVTMWSGLVSAVPAGWFLCDGSNGTPDLRDRFVYGASVDGDVEGIGGSANAINVAHTHTTPNHTHTANHDHGSVTSSSDAHTHTANHSHTGSTNSTGAHTHTLNGYAGWSKSSRVGQGNSSDGSWTATTNSAGDHSHTVTVNSAIVTTSSDTHSHTVNLPNLNVTTSSNNGGDTGSSGSSGTNANLPPYMKLAYIMKG